MGNNQKYIFIGSAHIGKMTYRPITQDDKTWKADDKATLSAEKNNRCNKQRAVISI